MKVYRAIEERGLALAFHSAVNIGEPVFKSLNRFASVHALGFPFYNIIHLTNWVTNGLGERFPKLPVIWIEGGLAWVPFLMQRLDHEYTLRISEYPLLKKKPSDYMRDMYYASQPMEREDMDGARMHLPHDQCGDPAPLRVRTIRTGTSTCRRRSGTCRSCPEKAKHNILWRQLRRGVFKLPPRSEKRKRT